MVERTALRPVRGPPGSRLATIRIRGCSSDLFSTTIFLILTQWTRPSSRFEEVAEAQESKIGDTSTLGDYAQLLRRRKWIVLQALVLVPLAVLAFTLTQDELYRGEAQVLLNSKDAVDPVLGLSSRSQSAEELDRDAATQAEVAKGPDLARRVLRRAGAGGRDWEGLVDDTEVGSRAGSDLLTFKVTDPLPARARELANAYADEYVRYRARLQAQAIDEARVDVERRLNRLGPGADGTTAERLRQALGELETVGALQATGAAVVRRADEAEQVQPKPVRNAAIGVFLGLLLGVALAFVRDLFDRRVRSADEAASLLGLPLLARLPGRGLRKRGSSRLPLVHEPDGPEADGYRTLMYRIQMVNTEHRAQVIMVSSAVEGEGKTTTAANLALALARSGRATALVELDLWRPALHRVFGFKTRTGLSDVLLGRAGIAEALVPADAGGIAGGTVNGGDPGASRLRVLPAGSSPSHPSDLIALPALDDVIASLRVREEVVILDAPPLVQGGDGIALAAKADALLIVTRLGTVRREGLQELRRRLADMPVPTLGVAVTDAELDTSDRWRRYYRAEPVAGPPKAKVG
jgi:capsular exopolysaccharide synthesis family protein